jgi:hypothetical protein
MLLGKTRSAHGSALLIILDFLRVHYVKNGIKSLSLEKPPAAQSSANLPPPAPVLAAAAAACSLTR